MKTIKKKFIDKHGNKIIKEYDSQNQLIKETTYCKYDDGCIKLMSIQKFYPKTENVFDIYEKEIIYRYDEKIDYINEYNKNDIRIRQTFYDEDGNIDSIGEYPWIDNEYVDELDRPISYDGEIMDDKYLEKKHDI